MTSAFAPMPNTEGYFGPYGGQLVPPHLKQAMDDINTAYAEITKRQDFQQELAQLFADYVGRPSPIDRKSTRLNSSHLVISYAVFCLKQKSDSRSRHRSRGRRRGAQGPEGDRDPARGGDVSVGRGPLSRDLAARGPLGVLRAACRDGD